MSSANTYSSIVDSLVNNAELFFPGGECKLCLVVTEIRLCGIKRFTRIITYRNSGEMRNQFLFLFLLPPLQAHVCTHMSGHLQLFSPFSVSLFVCVQVRGVQQNDQKLMMHKYFELAHGAC